jgi:hypothetical protein
VRSRDRAHEIIKDLKENSYPYGLVLKEEEINNGEFRFLETLTRVSRNNIKSEFLNKNIEQLYLTGQQKFYTFQSEMSFGDRRQKLGAIIARLIAIQHNVSSAPELFRAVGHYFIELRVLGHAKKTLKRACRRLFYRTGGDIWLLIPRILLSKNVLDERR